MITSYGSNISNKAIIKNLHRLINQTYKLLPSREEGLDWRKPLRTIIEEISGMDRVLIGKHDILFPLLCKLEGLYDLDSLDLTEEEIFEIYRGVIFESLNLLNRIKELCQDSTI